MRPLGQTVLRTLLSIVLGLFSIPMVGYGGYLLVCWARIHMSDLYYADYPYATAGLIWLAIGLMNLWATLYGVWRRSFRGFFLGVPVIIGFVGNEIVINHTPHVSSLTADINYLSGVHSSLDAWYENNHKYPTSEAEFRNAVRPTSTSSYKQHGTLLPYEVVVVTDADGARLTEVSQRPGVVYYCVSKDLREFWVTMTRLQSDMGSTAYLEPTSGLPQQFWVYHGVGRDHSVGTPENSNLLAELN